MFLIIQQHLDMICCFPHIRFLSVLHVHIHVTFFFKEGFYFFFEHGTFIPSPLSLPPLHISLSSLLH